MTIFLLTTRKKQRDYNAMTYFFLFEIAYVFLFFCDRRCEKAASQSLSYGIFAKNSGHFCTFSGAHAEGES